MAKRSCVPPKKQKKKYNIISRQTQSLIKFMVLVIALVSWGYLHHVNKDHEMQKTTRFFEQRKNVGEYHDYQQEEESAKKRAERNIFLQD